MMHTTNTICITKSICALGKLHIIRKDDSIEIKPKEWMDKKNWREVNETLVKYGFKWLSYGKDSCWIKRFP
jgi:hypothetical protein